MKGFKSYKIMLFTKSRFNRVLAEKGNIKVSIYVSKSADFVHFIVFSSFFYLLCLWSLLYITYRLLWIIGVSISSKLEDLFVTLSRLCLWIGFSILLSKLCMNFLFWLICDIIWCFCWIPLSSFTLWTKACV